MQERKNRTGLVTKTQELVLLALASFTLSCSQDNSAQDTIAGESRPIEVKIVLVTMFEIGADTGDTAGEFQLWKERRSLDQVFPFQAHHDLHFNAQDSILVIVTGAGTAKAAASIMALGMDSRFDLSNSYWLVAGIAGFDPADASVGSAAWAEYLVDGDLAHEIDAREKPEDWEWGYIARHTKVPFDPNKPIPRGEVFRANPSLAEWAFQLTRDMQLPDSEEAAAARARYTDHPNARRPPFVLKGDNLAALTFWHGEILNAWANAWVDYWSDGNGEFVSSAMEETGTFQSLTYLNKIDRVDIDRVMVLRTASNYTMPPPGVTAAENLLAENEGYSGLALAVESAYLVGSVVIDEILENWAVYEQHIPEATP
jgi:purine nucleoside permease